MKFEKRLISPRAIEMQHSKNYHLRFFSPDTDHDEQDVVYGTEGVVAKMTRWWENLCTENGVDRNDKRLKNIDYYIIELGKNALEYAEGGEISITFDSGKITVVISDLGPGFEDPNGDILYGSPGHGLSQVKQYADEFTIETNGKKFTKVRSKQKLVSTADTDIQKGSKITFVKKI